MSAKTTKKTKVIPTYQPGDTFPVNRPVEIEYPEQGRTTEDKVRTKRPAKRGK